MERPSTRWPLAAVLVCAFSFTPLSARADVFTFEAGAGTHVPVSFGADLTLDLPLGLFVRGHAGWMPSFYVDTINSVATGAGWYDDDTAELIRGAIENSLVLRGSAGWRIPFLGIEAFLGYTAMTLGGGATANDLITATTGVEVRRGDSTNIPLSASAHAFHFGLGWRMILFDIVAFRVAAGWLDIVSATVDMDAQAANPMAAKGVEDAEASLVDVLVNDVRTPVVEVGAGIRF